MRNHFYFLGALCLFLGLASSHAEPEVPPSPTQPILRRAPEFASWTIKLTRLQSPAPGSRIKVDYPVSVTVEKTNKIYREQTTMESGKISERWIYNNLELRTIPETGVVAYVPPQEDPALASFNFKKSDFDQLGWLSMENYQGVKKHDGKSAYYFDVNPAVSKDSAEKRPTAYLTTDTQLPLYSSNGWIACDYTYNAPPKSVLVPPEKFLKVFKQLEIDMKEAQRGPSR